MFETRVWLAIVAVMVSSGCAQGQTPGITWNGQMVKNNSLVTLSVVPNRISSSAPPKYPLVCQGITGGQWYEPNGVLFPLATPDPVTTPGGLGQRYNVSGRVELYRGTPSDFPHGVQCCTNTTITLCVGMYSDLTLATSVNLATSNPTNYALSVAATYGPNITGGVQFQLLTPTNVDPPVFQLTCTSTSSPPTDVLWTRNGSSVSNNSPQIVTDRPTSTYNNTLTVTGRAYGMYTCTVTTTCSPVCGGPGFTLNPRSTTSSLTVQAPPSPPTGVTAVQSGPTSVNVSWTAPTSGGPVTRYDIYYVANGGPSISGGSTNSTSYALTNLQVGVQYNISVIAVGTYLPSQSTSFAVAPALGQVTITGSVTTPTAGSPYSLTCTVPVIGWNGTLTTQLTAPNGNMLISNVVLASPGMNYTLQWPLSPLRTSDGGVYTCMVLYENYTLGTTTLSVTVTIPPPTVTISAVPSQVVIVGNNITLICNVQLDPSVDSTVMVTSTWTAPGGATLSGSNPLWIGSSNQSTLMLTSLGTGNAGNYVCEVTVTPINSQYITGPMGRNVSILVSVHTINITTSGSPVAGQMYTLTCTGTIVGDTMLTPVVTWSNPNGVITNRSDITVSNGVLTFNPLHTSHGGQYTCQSTQSSPFNSTTTVMNIVVQIPPPTVTITSTPISISYYAGTPLNLTCTVQLIAQVDTNVTFNSLWTGPGGQISSGVGRVSLSTGVNQTTVHFYPLNTTDTGVYNCSVSVSASGQQYVDTSIASRASMTSITVKALPAPQVTITPSGSSTAGSPYNLTCIVMVVNGLVVVPQVMWFKNGTSVIEGNGISLTQGMVSANTMTLSLQFNALKTSNGGQYSCIASISLTSISITSLYKTSSARVIVQIPPPLVATAAAPSQVVMEEDNITLTCYVQLNSSVDSTVMANIEWMEPGGAPINSTRVALVGSTYTNHTLYLPSVVTQESGMYTCRVVVISEYVISAYASSSIEVAIYSISIKVSSNTTIGGMNYFLTCFVYMHWSILTPNVVWIGPYGPVTNSNNTVLRDQSAAGERNVTILFNSLQTSHGGRYTCVSMVTTPAVTNVTARKDIAIQIPPPTVTITSTPITTSYYAGTPLKLTCTVELIPQVDTPIIATWFKGSSIIAIDNYIAISPLIRTNSSYATTLIFNPLGTADSGQYNCNVSVQPGAPYVISGVGGGSLSLQVLDLPAPNVTITPSPSPPSLGVAYSITCQVMGVAGLVLPIALTWTRTDGLSLGTTPVTNGSTITLSYPPWSMQNLAEYKCTAAISLPYKGIVVSSTASITLKAPGVVSGPALATPSNSSSVTNWSLPQQTNGQLTGYALSIEQLLDYGMPVNGSAMNASVDVTMTSYSWNGLIPGVPYQTCINAVNSLGPGDPWCKVFFTMEEVPSVAPVGVVVTRSSDGLSMTIRWSPLTLSQARGFVNYYVITYEPVGGGTRQLQTTSTNGTYVVVSGLNAILAYSVAVSGHTSVGLGPSTTMLSVPTSGPTSTASTPSPSTGPTAPPDSSMLTGAIAGAVIGGILTVLLVVTIILAILTLRAKWMGKLLIGTDSHDTKPQGLELTSINVTENVSYERITAPNDHVISRDTSIKNGNPTDLELTSNNGAENATYERITASDDHYEPIDTVSSKRPYPPTANEKGTSVGAKVALYHNVQYPLLSVSPPLTIPLPPFNTATLPSSSLPPPFSHPTVPSCPPHTISLSSSPPPSIPSTFPLQSDLTQPPFHHHTQPISVASFHDHVLTMHMNRNKGFQLEYHQLSDVKPEGHSHTVASLECNARKNRFGNILPCDVNRVKLKETPGVPGSDYINASHIDGYQHVGSYIASQGPKENTIADFWRMVWEKHIETIVMLTKCTEAGKNMCKQYWADEEGGVYDTNTLCITTTSVKTLADYDILRFEIKSKTKHDPEVHQVTHYQYNSWPDDEVPQFATSFLNFVRWVQKAHDRDKGVPLLVHCSAGVGRTGTFIALDTLLDRMRSETSISVFEVVKDMRKRRVLMVQTLDQYVFIHDALDEHITCGDTAINVTNMKVSINSLFKAKPGKTINGFQEQFSLLDMVSRKPTPEKCSDGAQPYNKAKNRYGNKLPYNASRPFLVDTGTEGSDYINASFIDGYKHLNAYLATQGPLQNTVEDFWRMVWEHKCRVIVMLCHLTEEGRESSYCYWPTEEEIAVSYDSISVTLQSQLLYDGYEVRIFSMRHKSENQNTVVTQLHFTQWPEHGRPINIASMVELIDTLTRTQMSTGNKPIVVHCNDGVGRTGTFITMYSELERLKAEGEVDVFQRVKLCRIARPGLVQNVDQYVYCHEFLASSNYQPI